MSLPIRPISPDPCPITNAETPAGRALLKAHAAWLEAFDAAESLEAQHTAAWKSYDEAEAQLAEAMRVADPAAMDAATEALDAARAERDRPWHRAAASAAGVCHGKMQAYRAAIDDGFLELLTEPELGPAAANVRTRILASVDDLSASLAQFQAVRRRHETLAAHASVVDTREVHDLGVLDPLRAVIGRIDPESVAAPQLYPGVADRHETFKRTGQLPTTSTDI